jgi:monoamine oxidase
MTINVTSTVVILGAGMAGLSALDALRREGVDALIVESRARPGGRVFTLRDHFSDGLHVEAGAQYIPSGHHRVLQLARDLGLTLDTVESPPRVMHVRGHNYVAGRPPSGPPPFIFTPQERALGLAGVLHHYLGEAISEVSRSPLEDHVPEELQWYDDLTMAQLLAVRGASPGLIARLRIGYLNHWGDGIDAYSALFGVRDLALNDTSEEYVVRGGTDRITTQLAKRLDERILYNAPVIAIEQNDDSVTLQIGDGRRITASAAICTIPFPALRAIDARWSLQKQVAIETLAYTAVSKTFLEIRDRFWDADGLAGHQSMMDEPKLCVWDRTAMQQQGAGAGVLEASFTGNDARRFLALSGSARLDYVLAHTEKIYPGIRERVVRDTTVCWDEDPWARGGYSWFRPGEMTTLLPDIIAPEGRIHFAGDHASARPGWMEGAIESGLRAAHEVQCSISELSKRS